MPPREQSGLASAAPTLVTDDDIVLGHPAPGIRLVRLPLPFALDHINVWLLADKDSETRDGWTLVDTGIASNLTRALWEQVIVRHMDGLPALRLLVTHFHPDHVGLADWLCQRFDIPLAMSRSEWLLAQLNSRPPAAMDQQIANHFYTRAGLSPEQVANLTARVGAYRQGVPAVPAIFQRLRDGQMLDIGGRGWQVICSGGHSPEHVCLFDSNAHILIAGDMVLPRISPNISVWPAEPAADPLSEYLAGLARLRQLPADTLVLPSHGQPFTGLRERIDELVNHHQERLAEIRTACSGPGCSVADITQLLFRRPLDTHQLSFAVGEALAHLNHLVGQGLLHRKEQAGTPDLFQV